MADNQQDVKTAEEKDVASEASNNASEATETAPDQVEEESTSETQESPEAATAADDEDAGDAPEATDASDPETPVAESVDATEDATPDEGASDEGREPASTEEREPPPAVVNRILEEAVEAASEDLPFPKAEEANFELAEPETPATSVTLDELQRSGEQPGFTGDVVGKTVSLDDLEETERQRTEDPVYTQFRQLVDQTSINVRERDIVQGRILKVGEKDVVIDIGYKSDGIVSRGEFDQDLQRGDTVEVYLERKEDRDGQLVLSKEKADRVRRWQRVERIYENEEIVEGTIIRRIKGGMIAELFDGLEAFLPGSQIDARPVRDFDAYLDKRMEFKIVKLNPSNENIVVSHRALIEEELEEQREKILEQMEVGQVLRGRVKNIVDFGAFIDLGGVDGLLHITDLSWGRVSHPSEVVELDEELDVVVLDYDQERQRISLGLKQLKEHPWENIGERYDEGETVEGKVVSITNYGAFVELEKGIEGLVHISEMSWTRHIKHPSQMVSLGQRVKVKILNIDEEEQKISLGMKQLEPDPWDGITDRYPPGTVLTGTVRNITNFGVFVEIEPGIDGLVHISDLSWTKKVRHPGDMVDRGQDMDVVILNIDEDRKRISLGHKQVKTNPWDQFSDAYSEGSDTTGEVVRVEDKGLVVELPLGVEAFVPGSELKNGPRNFHQAYAEGDELELRVIRFDQSRKDIVLSETAKDRAERHAERQAERREKQRERREKQEAVRDFQETQDDESASGPTTLGELSGLGDLKRQMQEAERQEAERQAAEEVEAREAEVADETEPADETDEAEDTTEAAEEAPADAEADTDAEETDAELAEAAEEAEVADEETQEATDSDEESGFPGDFPLASRLEDAGITTLAELREIDDLTTIKGIGPAYAEQITEALDELDNQ